MIRYPYRSLHPAAERQRTMQSDPMSKEDRIAVSRAIRVFDLFRCVDPDITMGAAVSFLHVASSEGLSVAELQQCINGPAGSSSASRYAQYLGKFDRYGKPGKELIEENYLGLDDRRRKSLTLSPRGRLLRDQVTNTLQPVKKSARNDGDQD